jgi:prephenate dehydratase
MQAIVAIQGQRGSYHDQAARQHFGDTYRPLCQETFEDVFQAVVNGHAEYALVAIHNTIHGPIAKNDQLLRMHAGRLTTIGDVALPIHHCLIGLPAANLTDIEAVHSQYEALMQCQRFLTQKLPSATIIEECDTAGSVALIKQLNNPRVAAIAGAAAAAVHGLHILARGIEDRPDNKTTFLVLRAVRNT